MKIKGLNITADEKMAFTLHMGYSFLDGIILGILALNEFIFLESLQGSNYNMSLIFLFSMAVMTFSVFFNEILRRTKSRKSLLRWVAITTRLPLLIFAIFPDQFTGGQGDMVYHYIYLGVFLIYFLAAPLILPSINMVLKQVYTHDNFGKLYSYATSLSRITTLIATFLFGIILDLNNDAFHYIFPIMAVISIASIYLLTFIKFKEPERLQITRGFGNSVKDSLKNMLSVLKFNKPYRDFEIGFMFYGFALMTTVTVIKIFLDETLINYSSKSFYLNLQVLISIILLPVFGKLLGKIDPRKFAILTFSALLFYLIFMALTEFYPIHTTILGIEIYLTLVLSYLSYGVFAATMGLLWWIGSAYFCKTEDAGHYQSIHLTLTGVRALFAPLLGVWFYDLFGYLTTFLIGITSLLIGIVLMFFSYRNHAIKT